ncbi:hypothetical protein ABK040_011868 [Willaertia magna]
MRKTIEHVIPNEIWNVIFLFMHRKYFPSLRLVSKSFYSIITYYFNNYKESFKFKSMKFDGELLQYVENSLQFMENLKTLTFSMFIPFNDEEWYQSISKLQKLENISGIRDTNGEWLQNVPNISNLKYLKFENSNVKLNIFEKFTNLDTLIIDCENFEKEENILLPNSLKHFTCMRKLDYESIENLIIKCHNLQELKINSNELNDELFEKMLINLHHLLCLKIFNIENSLTPQMYNIFKSNDIQFKLTKLRIPWYLSKENNECQKSLKHMSNTLQSISIDFIGDASVLDCKLFLKTIDNLKNLKKISLFMEHIAELLESSENDFPTILLPNLLKFKCICLDDDWSTFIECFLQPSLKTLIIHNRESFTDPYKINMEKYSFNLENLKLIGTFKFITDFIIDRTDFPTQFSNLVSLEGNEITDEFLPYLNGQLLQKLEIRIVPNTDLSLMLNQHNFIDCERILKSSEDILDKRTGKWADYLASISDESLNEEELLKELIINLTNEKNYTLTLKYIDDFLFEHEISLENELIYFIYFYETLCLVKTERNGNSRYYENLPIVCNRNRNHKNNEKLIKLIVELLRFIETTKQFLILSAILIENGKHHQIFINYSVLEDVPYEEDYLDDLLQLFELVIDSINFLNFEENTYFYYDFIAFLKTAFRDTMEDASKLISKCYIKFMNSIPLKLNNELRLKYLTKAKKYNSELDINTSNPFEDISLNELIKKEYPQIQVISCTIKIPNEKIYAIRNYDELFDSDKFTIDGFTWCVSLELLKDKEFFTIFFSLESIFENNDKNNLITNVTPFYIISMVNTENLVSFSRKFTSLGQTRGKLFPIAYLQPYEKTESESIFKFDVSLKILDSNVHSFSSYWKDKPYSILLDIPITTLSQSKRGMKFYSDPFEAFGLLWNLVFYPKGFFTSEQVICLRMDSEKNESIERVEIYYFISSSSEYNLETTFTGETTLICPEECIRSYSNQKEHEIKQVFLKEEHCCYEFKLLDNGELILNNNNVVSHFVVGGRHLVVCVDKTTLYTIGNNSSSQLGKGCDNSFNEFIKVNWNEDKQYFVKQIAVTASATIILTECGKLFSTFKSLSNSFCSFKYIPASIIFKDISSSWNSFNAISENGIIYAIDKGAIKELYLCGFNVEEENYKLFPGTFSYSKYFGIYTDYKFTALEFKEGKYNAVSINTNLPIISTRLTGELKLVFCVKNSLSIDDFQMKLYKCKGFKDITFL